MIPLENLALFWAASVALALAPGPDNIFVLTQSALHGRAAGLVVTLGLCTGLLAHTAAVALGVAALFQASAPAFNALKFVGAGYLLYLAWKAFRAGGADMDVSAGGPQSRRALYGRGVLMNVTNPKVGVFFLSFLPQFADPARGPLAPQMMVLGALFAGATVLVFGAVAWTAGFLGGRIRRSGRARVLLNRVAGAVFAGLALRLAAAER